MGDKRNIMKFINKPTPSHEKLIAPKNPHISRVGDKYIIRVVKDKQTYYFGSYDDIDEANKIEYQLQKRNYPKNLSNAFINKRGKPYIEELKKRLE